MTPEVPTNRASRMADAVNNGRPVEPDDVRQGRSGRRILMILLVSSAAAAALLFAVFAFNSPDLAATDGNARTDAEGAARFDQP